MNDRNPQLDEAQPRQPDAFLRGVIERNRRGEAVGTYAVCSAHPAHWRPYFRGDMEQQEFARAVNLSDRCRYYRPQPAVQEEVYRLLRNLKGALPLALLSQYLPCSCDAIRSGALETRAPAIIRRHIQRVLTMYAAACGVRTN
jgi:D-tagatose-1,6-bisphosphate aldolase subunit GatZ/KbaZ